MGKVLEKFNEVITEKVREDQFLSYKTMSSGQKDVKNSWLNSIVSFLNGSGGKLYLGLGENTDRFPAHISPVSLDRDAVSRIITSNIHPPVDGSLFHIEDEMTKENGLVRYLYIISVKPSDVKPHSCRGVFYVRTDDQDVAMNIYEIQRKIIETRAYSLIIAELQHNSRSCLDAFSAAQKNAGVSRLNNSVFSVPLLHLVAWNYLWSQGLISMLGQDFNSLLGIYTEVQRVNELISLSNCGIRGYYGSERVSFSFSPLMQEIGDRSANLRVLIDNYLREKGEKPT